MPTGKSNGVAISKTRVSTVQKKKIFLAALQKYHGVIQPALEVAKIDRSTYIKWKEKDPKFQLAFDNIGEAAVEFVESKLYSNIEKGKEISIIFYLKTRSNKYYEKTQLDVTSKGEKIVFMFGSNDEQGPEIKISE